MGRTRSSLVLAVVGAALCALPGCSGPSKIGDGPRGAGETGGHGIKLVVQITVDQLRGDLPMRYRDRLGSGGFRYLLEQGVHYTNAQYQHANTETAVGHATLATGADPSAHGIVGNDWVDPKTGVFLYNTEDERHHILGKEPKPHEGVSPRNLLSSTTGDELVLGSQGRSRVFSVSGKDRGAILPGGHAGKAFWYSKSSGQFVSSTYYYDAYPEWAENWNAAAPAEEYRGKSWELRDDAGTYLAREDDRAYEADVLGMGRVFPHPYGDDKYLTLRLGLTPPVDEMTLDFVQTLMREEKLGQGEATDFLAVSFSATDYVGHLFGPSSLESEDQVLRLDRVLASLFQAIDDSVGLDNALIVLSADHGGPEAPERASEIGIEAGRFPFDYFKTGDSPLDAALKERFGRSDLIADHSHPYLYLDEKAITEAGLTVGEVEEFVVDEVMKIPGIFYAVGSRQLAAGGVADSALQDRIRRSFSPRRSGNVHMVPDRYWFLHSTEEAAKMGIPGLAAIHGSPWRYDTYVPIFFAGAGLDPQEVSREVAPTDVAPTISAILGIKYPSGSVGTPLHEVVEGAR